MQARAAIYLDSNAGAPLHPRVIEALSAFFLGDPVSLAGNPSSLHSHGRFLKRCLHEAKRQIISSLLDLKPNPQNLTHVKLPISEEQLLLTSSGSEANQTAIRSALESLFQSGKKVHWITSPVEHDATRQMIAWVQDRGGEVDLVSITRSGQPDPESLSRLIRPDTSLVSLIWANNETGVLTDVKSIREVLKKYQIPLHLDAAQVWGKCRLDLLETGADWVSFSGHKIGALSGVGVLWAKDPKKKIEPLVLGKQQQGHRGGTENFLGMISLGAAASAIDVEAFTSWTKPLRDRLESEITQLIPGTLVNGLGADRVPNTLNLSFEGLNKGDLVAALDLQGYSVSAGSACASGLTEPSHVLLAMGLSQGLATSALRISLGVHNSWDEIHDFPNVLNRIVTRMRG